MTVAAPPQVLEFKGRWQFLSNFFPSPFELDADGIGYPTAEHAFQAQKTLDMSARMRISDLSSPGAAKAAGRRLVLRPGWEQVKKRVMLEVVLTKFTCNPELARQLAATRHAQLVEGNWWHDNYWGACKCDRCAGGDPQFWADRGLNYLGEILMAVRMVLREDR